MNESKVQKFKKASDAFIEAWKWIKANEEELKKDPIRFEKIRRNFDVKFDQPLIAAFETLDIRDKDRFGVLFYLRREEADRDLDEALAVARMFKGKIFSIHQPRPRKEEQKNA